MSEEWDDIQEMPEEEEEEFEATGEASGKFARLLGSDSRKFKLSGMFKD